MPSPNKPTLLKLFEDALRKSGISFLRLPEETSHPASYQIIRALDSYRLRVYIWNLTFGGRKNIPDEWRIQVTGLPDTGDGQRFSPEIEGKTAILGWCEDLRVFAAYDIEKHLGVLGVSPSIQIRQPALEAARINGLAPHFKGEGEAAFAVKPAYMGVYLDNMEELHTCGSSAEALQLLEYVCKNPQNTDQDIDSYVSPQRQYAVISTWKALRDTNFRNRVLTAYSNACAMCGMQLRLLDAAHILPAAHPNSTDETCNGIALCSLHHRAYDRGLVTFDTGYRIHRNEAMEHEFVTERLDGKLADFQKQLFPMLEVPPDRTDWPAAVYIEQVNAMRGWNL